MLFLSHSVKYAFTANYWLTHGSGKNRKIDIYIPLQKVLLFAASPISWNYKVIKDKNYTIIWIICLFLLLEFLAVK